MRTKIFGLENQQQTTNQNLFSNNQEANNHATEGLEDIHIKLQEPTTTTIRNRTRSEFLHGNPRKKNQADKDRRKQ